jgi:hypothetical protein
MNEFKFKIGDPVFKHTGDYTGRGIVRGVVTLPNDKPRYLVGHTINGGTGEFLHIYAAYNLKLVVEGKDEPS